MKLNPNADLNTINSWLAVKLTDENKIVAKAIELERVPKQKGIYFWFMKSDRYQELSHFINITPIANRITKSINGVNYDLIYLGTAGTGKKGKSNLKERLTWHISQPHSDSSICSGILSTFKAGLGSLLADDLQLGNTAEIVNKFQETLIVYWISYDDHEKEVIDFDEDVLIKIARPLFNIKNNPNAKSSATDNATKRYKKRRALVYENSRNRLKCKRLSSIKVDKNTALPPIDYTPMSYEHQVDETGNCISFILLQNQSIHDVVNGIDNLPKGKCKFLIQDSNDVSSKIYASNREQGWRSTGNGVSQNIYNYFNNVDTKVNNRIRWEIIQTEMKDRKIDEATVIVCEINNDENKPVKNKEPEKKGPKIPSKKSNIMEASNLKLSNKFNVVMICSGQKVDESEIKYNGIKIDFGMGQNQVRPTDQVPNLNMNWIQYVKENQIASIIPFEAYVLYRKTEYSLLHNRYNLNFHILSAGWGLVKSTTRLPNYNITFNENYDLDSQVLFNQFDVKNNDDIIFISSGNKGYHKLFNTIIQGLSNRVIVYYRPVNGGFGKDAIPPNVKQIYKKNDNVILRAWNGDDGKRDWYWYYKLANEIALLQNPQTINDLPGEGIFKF
jgi:hypothetical protein